MPFWLCGDRPLAAHNADFDMGFIAEGDAGNMAFPSTSPSMDSLILAQNLLPELGKNKLDIVAEHLHLPAFSTTTGQRRCSHGGLYAAPLF